MKQVGERFEWSYGQSYGHEIQKLNALPYIWVYLRNIPLCALPYLRASVKTVSSTILCPNFSLKFL